MKGDKKDKSDASYTPGGDIPSFGYFSTPGSIGVGDPYVKRLEPDSRHIRKQLQTNTVKRGQTGDNWNQPNRSFLPLFENEKYVEPGSLEKQMELEAKKKHMSLNGFTPSSPPKRWSGLGSHYGCIGPQHTHSVDGYEKKEKKAPEPKQPQTSPAKKGGYGYPGTTIGQAPKYIEDDYNRPRLLALEETKQHKKKFIGKELKTMSHGVDFFDSQPNVAVSKIYTNDRPLPPARLRPITAPEIKTPFIPSATPKIGYNATFQPFPEHKGTPYDGKLQKDREDAKSRKAKIIGEAYKPTSRPKSTPQASISMMSITLHSIRRDY